MKKISLFLTLLLLCTFVLYSRAGEVRTWTAGNHSVEGEFVELLENGAIVRIRKTNGKFTRVPLAKLSEEDQEYIKEEAGNTGTTLPASSLKPGNEAGERKVLTVDGIEYAFRWCPPGEFMMGGDKYSWEKPVHKVKLTRGFWLLETEVTQAMWESVMGQTVKQQRDKADKDLPMRGEGPNYPMYYVSWEESQEFCKKLSQKLGQQVKLPTEAQWEYACRAGTTGDYAGNLDEMAWYEKNSTHAVGQKKPNAWGLYDMHGNVWEWCSDWDDENYYSKSPTSDPENTEASSYRVFRGGGWYNLAVNCRSANRFRNEPGYRIDYIGLRVLVVPGQE